MRGRALWGSPLHEVLDGLLSPKDDTGINIAKLLMFERLWKSADDREAPLVLARADHVIE